MVRKKTWRLKALAMLNFQEKTKDPMLMIQLRRMETPCRSLLGFVQQFNDCTKTQATVQAKDWLELLQ